MPGTGDKDQRSFCDTTAGNLERESRGRCGWDISVQAEAQEASNQKIPEEMCRHLKGTSTTDQEVPENLLIFEQYNLFLSTLVTTEASSRS